MNECFLRVKVIVMVLAISHGAILIYRVCREKYDCFDVDDRLRDKSIAS